MTHASLKSLFAARRRRPRRRRDRRLRQRRPAGAVAKVGDATITQDEFDKWLEDRRQRPGAGRPARPCPDPPDFTKCVAAKKKAAVPQGPEAASDAAAQEAVQAGVRHAQARGHAVPDPGRVGPAGGREAGRQGLRRRVKRSFEDQKKQAFPTDKAYQQFLKTSGMSEEDILFRVKLDQLQQKLTQKITEDATKVSDEDIEEYYDKNKKRFAQPERRDLRVVLTKTEAKAEQAKEALDDGEELEAGRRRSTRSTRPRRPRAASCPPWPRASRRRRSTRRCSRPRRASSRARSRPSSAGTSSRSTKITAGLAADARAVQGDDQEPAPLAAPAEGARRVHQGLPRGLQGRDRLRRRLPGGRVQERSEGGDRHRSRLRRRARRRRSRSPQQPHARRRSRSPRAALQP